MSGDEQLVRDFLAFAGTAERALDFNRFVPYPTEFAERDRVAEAWRDARPMTEWFSGPTDGFNSGGFEWCVEHWGTKWNARRAARGECPFGGRPRRCSCVLTPRGARRYRWSRPPLGGSRR